MKYFEILVIVYLSYIIFLPKIECFAQKLPVLLEEFVTLWPESSTQKRLWKSITGSRYWHISQCLNDLINGWSIHNSQTVLFVDHCCFYFNVRQNCRKKDTYFKIHWRDLDHMKILHSHRKTQEEKLYLEIIDQAGTGTRPFVDGTLNSRRGILEYYILALVKLQEIMYARKMDQKTS